MTTTTDLQEIADAVVRRAARQGFVVPREIREEVAHAGLPEEQWKEVLDLARPSLNYRHGRYYHLHTVSERIQQELSQQQQIHSAIRHLIQQHRAHASRVERREQDRIDFIQSVEVETDDHRTFHLLSRDISSTGVRLIGTRSFLGQKVRLTIPQAASHGPWRFLVRILWTCSVGDDLFENGGTFLEALPIQSAPQGDG
jgi:hypothetical protein